jgi:hypothetical protein
MKKDVTREEEIYTPYDGVELTSLYETFEKYKDKKGVRLRPSGTPYDSDLTLYIVWEEEETDKEYTSRLKAEKDQIAYRRRTYEQLKKEFEGK